MRLTSDFWVRAYMRRLALADIPAFVVAHGDDIAGAVLVKVSTLDGQACLYQRTFDLRENVRHWTVLTQGDEAAVESSIQKQRGFDRDLWVIEVEDRQGRSLLDEPGLGD